MNFLGAQNYQHFPYYTFPEIPNFRKQKKNVTYDASIFQGCVYQRNIAQILQWIEYIEKESTVSLSSKLYRLAYKKQDEQNVFIMDKNKLNLVQILGNTGFSFLKKICKNCTEYTGIYNEYFVTIYGLNYLRQVLPTFNFTYALHNDRQFLSVKQEYTQGESLESFVHHCSMEQLYQVFFQIILSLEIAQRELLFTHYDLNFENILVETVETPFFILLGDTCYRFEAYKVKIIDFGFSTVTTNPRDIFSNCSTRLYHYGYFPFYTPGTDMFRVIGHLSHGGRGQKRDFGLFLMETLYGIPRDVILRRNRLDELRKRFFSCTCFPFVYKIPLECLNVLESTAFLQSFGISSSPKYTGAINQSTENGEKEFKQIFSIDTIQKEITNDPRNNIYTGTNRGKPPCVIPKKYPNFLLESNNVIQSFYDRHVVFLNWFSPSSTNLSHHVFFRVLSCFGQYLAFSRHSTFQFTESVRQEVVKYMKPLMDVLCITS